jgi:hypothetical protein
MSTVNPTLMPVFIIPMVFLFVLLIVLINKSPRVGVWLIGGLVFAVPILLYRGVVAGPLRGPMALPLIIIPVTFLFVLLTVLLSKAPKAGVGLIVALVVMGVLGVLGGWGMHTSRGRTRAVEPLAPQSWSQDQQIRLQTGRVAIDQGGKQVVIDEAGELTVKGPPALPALGPSPRPPAPPVLPAPIWSPGVETEMDADVYPSKLAAVRALGSRLDRPVRELVGEVNAPPRITIFQEESERALVVELKNAVQQILPLATVQVEAEQKNLDSGQVGVTLRLADLDMQPAPWADSREVKTASGKIELDLATTTAGAAVQGRFVEKPWLENFATFASTRPQQAYIIARSLGTCTSESEANQQALDDARARLTEAIGQRRLWMSDKLPKPEITAPDVLQGGFIVDRFAQSFEGTVGKVWRQALLLDVSGLKLAQLANKKAREFREAKMTWARMGLSAVGVVLLIGVIYFFLNMATMGYYEWSLRIASVVLAIVGVLSILMVVK